MYYIVDANNLAGELRLLKQNDFDQKMIAILDEFARKRKKKVIAVFDGFNQLGERFDFGALQVEYAPRDSFYTSADDKVVELAKKYGQKTTEEVVVVTNDRELKERVELVNIQDHLNIGILGATDFALLLQREKREEGEKEEEDKELTDSEKEDINDELLRIWK